LGENGHMIFFSQWEHLNFSIELIYAKILFIGQGPALWSKYYCIACRTR